MGFTTLGCKVNQVDTELIAEGIRSSLGGGLPDGVAVINSCAVTAEAVAKTRKAIHRAARDPQTRVVIVTGCAAAVVGDALAELDSKVRVVPDRSDVPAVVAGAIELFAEPVNRYDCTEVTAEPVRARRSVKIQDGCQSFCSYCIVPYARGEEHSVPLDSVVTTVRELVEGGVQEVVLTGINIGRYRDPASAEDLAGLIDAIRATGLHRLRLSSIEPNDVTGRLLSALSADGFGCEHLHIPLQSGSDSTLANMNRQYGMGEYFAVIDRVRSVWPDAAITTDLIVGFPTEGEAAWAESLANVERIGFSKVHTFRYSRREGTAAAALPPLPPDLVRTRADAALVAAARLVATYSERFIGAQVEVVVERIKGDLATVTSREYLTFEVPADGLTVGQVTRVTYHG